MDRAKVFFDELKAQYVSTSKPAKNGEVTSSKSESGSASQVEATPKLQPIELKTQSGGQCEYLLVSPDTKVAKPQNGYPLLLILPGGDGSADFHPFVKAIHQYALAGRFAVAQPLAPPQIIWPTKSSVWRIATTEESIAAIIRDVSARLANRFEADLCTRLVVEWTSDLCVVVAGTIAFCRSVHRHVGVQAGPVTSAQSGGRTQNLSVAFPWRSGLPVSDGQSG